MRNKVAANNAINSDVQKRRFALLLHAGYGERYISDNSYLNYLRNYFANNKEKNFNCCPYHSRLFNHFNRIMVPLPENYFVVFLICFAVLAIIFERLVKKYERRKKNN